MNHNRAKSVLVALSGGVDSSVAAAILVESGYRVVGAYMKNWVNEEGIPGDCPWEKDIEDASAVAQKLGIEFRIIDLIHLYHEKIVDYLVNYYREGLTPNPDIYCNKEIKFGAFLNYALEQGFDFMATGHYMRRGGEEDLGQFLRGLDANKDQSYFLALTDYKHLQKALFPIGNYQKTEVRKKAQQWGLPTAAKKDSQGICFIGQVKMKDFLSHYIPDKTGEIVDLEGKVLGQHRGLHFYTIGQRKGHGVASPRDNMAYVVVKKELETNRLVMGWDQSETQNLYTKCCEISSLNFLGDVNELAGQELTIQPRYRAEALALKSIEFDNQDCCRVEFVKPQRAIALGQIAAFYQAERLWGGGVFSKIESYVEA